MKLLVGSAANNGTECAVHLSALCLCMFVISTISNIFASCRNEHLWDSIFLYFSSEVMANYLAWQTTPPGEDSGSSYIFMLFLVFLLSFGCLLHGTTKVQHFVTSLQCRTMPNCFRLHVSDFTNFYRFYR